MRRLFVSVLATSLLFAASSPSRADDDPRKKAAEATFKEGVKLHAQGKNEEALAKLKEAYATYPSPNTLAGIARVEQALGRRIDAVRHYREALQNPLMHPDSVEATRKAVAELEQRLGRVDVSGPKGLVVTIDGQEHVLPLREPVDVMPDTITVSGKLGEVAYTGRATAVIGKVTTIEMSPVEPPSTATSSATAPGAPPPGGDRVVEPPPPSPSSPSWGTGQTVGVALWGGALLAGGAGVFFTLKANDAASEIEAARARSSDPDRSCAGVASPECDARREADEDRASNTNLAVGSFVAAGVFAAGGAAAFFLWPRSRSAIGRSDRVIAPVATHQGGGIFLRQVF